jgi:predicted kinase
MPRIHLIEGPVGAGKSTFATRLGFEVGAPRIDLDEWMVVLFSPDRPDGDFVGWYQECKRRCLEQIWRLTVELIEAGTSVVLELGLVARHDRGAFYERVDAAEYALDVHVLQTPEAVRRQRVRERNQRGDGTFKMHVPDEIFELANRAWEAPDDREIEDRGIRFVESA